MVLIVIFSVTYLLDAPYITSLSNIFMVDTGFIVSSVVNVVYLILFCCQSSSKKLA